MSDNQGQSQASANLKFAFLANGIAAIAMLAFLGLIYTINLDISHLAIFSLLLYLFGVGSAGFAYRNAYASELSFTRASLAYTEIKETGNLLSETDWDKLDNKRKVHQKEHEAFSECAGKFILSGILCFLCGSIIGAAALSFL